MKRDQLLQTAPVQLSASDRDLSGALHEVSNALTVVLGWLDHARPHLDKEEAREALAIARSHAALGHAIARRAIGASAPEVEADVRSAAALAREAVRGVAPQARKRSVHVELDDNASDVMLPGATAVQQVLLNLLLNALAFTPAGRSVRLSTHNEGVRFLFRVRDEGPGVPADQHAEIFASTPSRRPGGAGIGLAHSHGLAERHGGILALQSGTGRGGACFELRWPTTDTPSTTISISSAPRMLEGLRVAVLEDDRDVMGMLELGLASRGVELIQLATREALLQFAGNGSTVDAALIDLSPIANDPQSAIAALRKNSPKAAVFLISGTVLQTDTGDGIAGWIRKPFELGEIYQALALVQTE